MECIFHSFRNYAIDWFYIKNIGQNFLFVLSAIALLVFYITTFMNAFKQIKLIKTLITHDLATIQSSLVLLNTHFVNYAKLAILFIPSFLTYPVIISKIIKDFNIKGLADVDIIAKSNGELVDSRNNRLHHINTHWHLVYKSVTYYNLDKNGLKILF